MYGDWPISLGISLCTTTSIGAMHLNLGGGDADCTEDKPRLKQSPNSTFRMLLTLDPVVGQEGFVPLGMTYFDIRRFPAFPGWLASDLPGRRI